MRAVIQRVLSGRVTVDNVERGKIGLGLVVLVGVGTSDTSHDAIYLADKTANLRIFDDQDGKMNLSCLDISGQVLAISQFTLYGDCRKGRRPNFLDAAPPDLALALYHEYVDRLKEHGLQVATGVFGEMMVVEIENNGPVTLLLDSEKEF